jgi:serine/threonine protein kinase
MSSLANDELLEVISRSRLVPDDRLEEVRARCEDSRLLEELTRAGLLTPWQAERLSQGKWRGYFLGKYKILRPLGAGAMGSVYLAEHNVMRHRVAIKVLAKRLVARPNNVLRFEREARAAAAVNHPNVVRAFDIDREGDAHYLVMEYVDGQNLQEIVQSQGPLDPRLAADYIRQVALGLEEAHCAGLVHRDVKPSNVLVDRSGVVKVLDLGLARMEDEDLPAVTIMNGSRLIGTVDYLAPEQALNSHSIDGRADIYSLGCTLYFLLTGSAPFPTGSLTERVLKHQTKRPAAIEKRRAGVPKPLCDICFRMLEKKPEKRYQTGDECAAALAAFLAGESLHQPAASDSAWDEDGLTLAEGPAARSSTSNSASRSCAHRLPAMARSGPASSLAGEELELAPVDVPPHRAPADRTSPQKPPGPVPAQSLAAVPQLASILDELPSLPAMATSSNAWDALPADTLTGPGGTTAGGSLAPAPVSAAEALLASARKQTGSESKGSEINYPLWFLVFAGLVLGVILVVVGFSYVASFNHKQDIKVENREKP